jgi:hypothetical protein
MFLDMRFDRQKIRIDEGRDAFIRVRLGLQPSTGPSSGGRAEIDQDRPAGVVRLFQRGIDVLAPLNCHGVILSRPARGRAADPVRSRTAATAEGSARMFGTSMARTRKAASMGLATVAAAALLAPISALVTSLRLSRSLDDKYYVVIRWHLWPTACAALVLFAAGFVWQYRRSSR